MIPSTCITDVNGHVGKSTILRPSYMTLHLITSHAKFPHGIQVPQSCRYSSATPCLALNLTGGLCGDSRSLSLCVLCVCEIFVSSLSVCLSVCLSLSLSECLCVFMCLCVLGGGSGEIFFLSLSFSIPLFLPLCLLSSLHDYFVRVAVCRLPFAVAGARWDERRRRWDEAG